MSDQQKSAVFVHIVGTVAILSYLALLVFINPEVAPAAMALLALIAVPPVIYPQKISDEREIHLSLRAAVAGATASYLFLVVVCMGIWISRFSSADATISVSVLPQIAMGVCVVILVVRSVTYLLMSRRPLDLAA